MNLLVTPVRRSRPPTTTKLIPSTAVNVFSDDDDDDNSKSSMQQKIAGLTLVNRRENNTGLILLVVLLSGALVVITCGVLLYKRRNDRRIRYLTETFHSFGGKKLKSSTVDSFDKSDEVKLNLNHNLASASDDDKSILKYPHDRIQDLDHIYSEDPLENKTFLKTHDNSVILYDYIDYATINQQTNDQPKSI
ncbi:unnamed protein product [Rotaria socialis]